MQRLHKPSTLFNILNLLSRLQEHTGHFHKDFNTTFLKPVTMMCMLMQCSSSIVNIISYSIFSHPKE